MPILLETHSTDLEFNGDCDYAVVDITPALVELVRQRVALARQAGQQDPELWELYFWDNSAEFYDSDLIDACEQATAATAGATDPDQAARNWLVDLEHNGHALVPDNVDLTMRESQRVECRQAIVRSHFSDRKAEFELAWTAIPKHSDVCVTTRNLPLATLEGYLCLAKGALE